MSTPLPTTDYEMPPQPWWNISCYGSVFFTDPDTGHRRRVTFNRLHITAAGEWLIGAVDLDDGKQHWFPRSKLENVSYNP